VGRSHLRFGGVDMTQAEPYSEPRSRAEVDACFVARPGRCGSSGTEEAAVNQDSELLKVLNDLLADELTAINQYMVHAELCEEAGYGRLEQNVRARAMAEMRHAEKLIERILFLGGEPAVSSLKKVRIGRTVEEQFANDRESEQEAIAAYNKAIGLAAKAGDNGTRALLEEILKEEEGHLDWIETQRVQVEQMGLQIYLGNQTA